jgi:hypothetical protein
MNKYEQLKMNKALSDIFTSAVNEELAVNAKEVR